MADIHYTVTISLEISEEQLAEFGSEAILDKKITNALEGDWWYATVKSLVRNGLVEDMEEGM